MFCSVRAEHWKTNNMTRLTPDSDTVTALSTIGGKIFLVLQMRNRKLEHTSIQVSASSNSSNIGIVNCSNWNPNMNDVCAQCSVCDIHNYSISCKTPQQCIHFIDIHKQTCILLISMTSDLLPTRTTGRRLPSGTMRRNNGSQCEVICRTAKTTYLYQHRLSCYAFLF